jgi:hypothetical protein
MGGQIRVIIRKENGEVIKQSRHTNPLPLFIKNRKLFQKDEEYINNYIEIYKNSYYKSKKELLSPNIEYGLVVIDLKENWVGSMNGYSGFEYYHLSGLTIPYGDENGRSVYMEYVNAKEFYDNNELDLIKISHYNETTTEREIIPVEDFTIESIENLMRVSRKEYKKNIGFTECNFYINYSKLNWSINEYPEDVDGCISFLKDLLCRGFNISKEEINDWQEYLNNRFSEDNIEWNPNLIISELRNDVLKDILE